MVDWGLYRSSVCYPARDARLSDLFSLFLFVLSQLLRLFDLIGDLQRLITTGRFNGIYCLAALFFLGSLATTSRAGFPAFPSSLLLGSYSMLASFLRSFDRFLFAGVINEFDH